MNTWVYKLITAHDHEVLLCIILSRILHAREPHIGGRNGGVKSDLATLDFKQGNNLKNSMVGLLVNDKNELYQQKRFL